jgi:1-acyl-sn-glycerol-3-phosphate acyltransferase
MDSSTPAAASSTHTLELDAKAQRRKERALRAILEQKPPSVKWMGRWCSPLTKAFDPVFYGLENVPSNPGAKLMFVGNHTMMALDLPVLLFGLLQERGLFVRTMGDHFHFHIPGWKRILMKMGVVDGTREICRALLEDNHPVLIYPGGAREAFKKKSDPKYALFWADHKGFARMAIQTEAIIVPVTVLGMEDMIGVLCDIPASKKRDLTVPAMKPPGPRKYQRLYYHFGPPIPTAAFQRNDCEANSTRLRDQTQEVILSGLRFLQAVQRVDPNRFGYVRMLRELLPWLRERKALTGSKDGEVVVGERPTAEADDGRGDTTSKPTGPLEDEEIAQDPLSTVAVATGSHC